MAKYLSIAATAVFTVGAVIAFLQGNHELAGALLAGAGGTGFLPQAVGQ